MIRAASPRARISPVPQTGDGLKHDELCRVYQVPHFSGPTDRRRIETSIAFTSARWRGDFSGPTDRRRIET